MKEKDINILVKLTVSINFYDKEACGDNCKFLGQAGCRLFPNEQLVAFTSSILNENHILWKRCRPCRLSMQEVV